MQQANAHWCCLNQATTFDLILTASEIGLQCKRNLICKAKKTIIQFSVIFVCCFDYLLFLHGLYIAVE